MFPPCRFTRSYILGLAPRYRAPKGVIPQTKQTDAQQEHSCIQHLFTLYWDSLQTSFLQITSLEILGYKPSCSERVPACIYTAAPAAGAEPVPAPGFNSPLCRSKQPGRAERDVALATHAAQGQDGELRT